MRKWLILGSMILFPAGTSGQSVDPVEKLQEVLPPEVAEQILLRIQDARSSLLPGEAVANLALEGVAKGRSSQEVLGAVEALLLDMGRAQTALQDGGHRPVGGEIQAATAALRMGVDGASVTALARSGIEGRSLELPLLVMGGLAGRGLPADQALTMVRDRIAAGFSDAELYRDFAATVRGPGAGFGPGQTGPAIGGGLGGFQVPVAGITVPVGPPTDRPGRRGPPGGRPGGN